MKGGRRWVRRTGSSMGETIALLLYYILSLFYR